MIRTPVQSSNVVSVGYDDDNQVLEVEFKSGLYRYMAVPRQVFEDFLLADSKGRFINQIVKPNFLFHKVDHVQSAD